jgi:hypothetical protein
MTMAATPDRHLCEPIEDDEARLVFRRQPNAERRAIDSVFLRAICFSQIAYRQT